MSEQVEALEIANKVDTKIVSYPPRYVYCDAAAAELRRQHQEIQELKQAKEELLEFAQRLGDVPCPLEVYVWLYKYNILDMRKAVIMKHKD